MFDLKWEERALDELHKLERQVISRILKKVNELKTNPFLGDVKKLKGLGDFRLRVGDYRVLFSVDSNLIKILKVGHRKKIYDR